MVSQLEGLLPNARTDGSLATLKNGKPYYTYLFQSSVGTLRSVPDSQSLIQKALKQSQQVLKNMARKHPNTFSKAALLSATTNTPQEILAHLEKAIDKDFPSIDKVKYEVKFVPKSLEDHLSPAFYLTPPIDDSSRNTIYVNGGTKYEGTNLFPTLAHEGYSGHLFQAAFLHRNLSSPLQATLNFGGYCEGWATYAEIYSYQYAKLEPDVVSIMQNQTILSLCLYALCDIGIHYEGWDLTATGDFLEKYGISDISQVLSVYQNIIDEPVSYPKYTMGYLEIMELKALVQKELGKDYTDKMFHTWYLSMGPTWFEILRTYIHPWFDKLTQNKH